MSLFGEYGSDYRRVVFFQRLFNRSREDAFAAAVGGAFDEVGAAERDVLLAEGLRDDDFLVDVGCGAGRLATRLMDRPGLRYLGLDVVPDLIDYAREQTGRDDWRFECVSRSAIPAETGSVDMCAAFSLFTHLQESASNEYLAEMSRVLRPGGVAVFSFLDPDVDRHRKILKRGVLRSILTRTVFAKNVGLSKNRIAIMAARAGFAVRKVESPSKLGQSLAVFEKRQARR